MRVNVWKTVEIETDVDVCLDDCINELLDTANDDEGSRRKIEAAGNAMRILEKIGPDVFTDKQFEAAKVEIKRRLQMWITALMDHDLPQRITNELFTNGSCERAERLVLAMPDGKDGGGWIESSATKCIERVLKGEL